jgi:hypothetical protein
MKSNTLHYNFYAISLFRIKDKLLQWDYSTVEGTGVVAKFSGRGKYAHVELSISNSPTNTNEVIWNITEEQIPNNFGHKPYIEEALSFFLAHVSALTGNRVYLKFDINFISFHITDSHPRDFLEATMNAIVNSFDPTAFPFDKNQVERIIQTTYNYQKENNMLKKDIIESLKNEVVTEKFSKIISQKNIDSRMLNGIHFNSYTIDLFENRKALLSEDERKYLQTQNAIDYYERLTNIGKAHIAKTLNDYYDLNYHFDIQKEDYQ